jgi:hypothetical protein
MQLANRSRWELDDWEFVDPPVFDEPPEPVDDGLLCVAVELSCAT